MASPEETTCFAQVGEASRDETGNINARHERNTACSACVLSTSTRLLREPRVPVADLLLTRLAQIPFLDQPSPHVVLLPLSPAGLGAHEVESLVQWLGVGGCIFVGKEGFDGESVRLGREAAREKSVCDQG